MSRVRDWVFRCVANEAKGEQLSWPVAGKEQPPLHDWTKAKHFRYMVYQCERAPTTGMIHLQGIFFFIFFFIFSKSARIYVFYRKDVHGCAQED